MSFSKKWITSLAVLVVTAVPALSFATNGYMLHGYGIKAKGMGGVGIALPQDTICAANNPAGMAWVGNRFDVGADYFHQTGTATISTDFDADNNGSFKGTRNGLIMPEVGANWTICNKWSVGFSGYSLGAIDVKYNRPFESYFGTTNLRQRYQQWVLSPTVGYKINNNHALGLSLNIAYANYQANGFQFFKVVSASPGNVTDNGTSNAWGLGLSLGWVGHLTSKFDMGLTYRSPTWMSKFKKYQGLLANKGRVNLPSVFGAGFTYHFTDAFLASLDVEGIIWHDAKALRDPPTITAPVGSSSGFGMGWRNQFIAKLGVAYMITTNWTVRAGWNYGRTPIKSTYSFQNMTNLDTTEQTGTVGLSYNWGANELNAFYAHAFRKMISAGPETSIAGVSASLKMSQDSVGISYGRKF